MHPRLTFKTNCNCLFREIVYRTQQCGWYCFQWNNSLFWALWQVLYDFVSVIASLCMKWWNVIDVQSRTKFKVGVVRPTRTNHQCCEYAWRVPGLFALCLCTAFFLVFNILLPILSIFIWCTNVQYYWRWMWCMSSVVSSWYDPIWRFMKVSHLV